MAGDTAGVGRATEGHVSAPAKDYRREFYLAEFNALRKEVEIRLAEINQIEYQVFLGAAATYAWLLTRPTDTSALSKVGWAVPLFLALYGYFKIKHSIGVLRKLGQYICSVETAIYHSGPAPLTEAEKSVKGWEHIFAPDSTALRSFFPNAVGMHWPILFVFAVIGLAAAILEDARPKPHDLYFETFKSLSGIGPKDVTLVRVGSKTYVLPNSETARQELAKPDSFESKIIADGVVAFCLKQRC